MSRIRNTAIFMGLLATLSVVGCICPPVYQTGMNRGFVSAPITYNNGCDPCGAAEACAPEGCGGGVIHYGGNVCAPQHKFFDSQGTFNNLSNGVLLTGRGILDVVASPFVIASNLLSSNCRYEVLAFCNDAPYVGQVYQTSGPCCSVGSTGCDNCAGGFTEGIHYNVNTPQQTTMLPTPPRRNHSVIQASYQEPKPTAPAARFIQPGYTARR